MLPSVVTACTAIFWVAPVVLHSFLILGTYLESPGRKMTDFQSFATLAFSPVGGAGHQCIRTLSPVPASGSASMCSPQFCSCSDPKWTQTPSVDCMRSKWAMHKTVWEVWKQLISICFNHPLWCNFRYVVTLHTLNVQISLSSPIWKLCALDVPDTASTGLQTSMSKCPLSWYFGCLSCHVLVHLQPTRQWRVYSCGTMNPWHQFLKMFYLGDTDRIFIMPLVSRSCFLLLRLLFPLWIAFLYNLQLSSFSPPTASPTIRTLSSITLHTFLNFC